MKYDYLRSVKFWVYIIRLFFLAGVLFFLGGNIIPELMSIYRERPQAAITHLALLGGWTYLVLHNVVYIIKIARNRDDEDAYRQGRELSENGTAARKLRRKYKDIIFSVYFFGLLLGMAFTYLLTLVVAEMLSVSLSMKNCIDDKNCAALSVVMITSFPVFVGLGIILNAFFFGGRLGLGHKESLRIFISSRFPESWYIHK